MPTTRRRPGSVLAAALVAVVALVGCASGSSESTEPSSSADPSASGTTAPETGPLELDLTINNLQVAPALDRFSLEIGDEVRLSVTSDEDDTIHVHGVERLLVVTAGETGVLEFTVPAGVPRGMYTIEAHDAGLILAEFRIR